MKVSLQEYADRVVDPKFQQSLKSFTACIAEHGWEHGDNPTCCGKPLEIENFIFGPHYIGCNYCGKFMADMGGPKFGNGHVRTIDPDKVEKDTPLRWITGTMPDSERRVRP